MTPSENSTGTRGLNPIDPPPLPIEEEVEADRRWPTIPETKIREIISILSTEGITAGRPCFEHGEWRAVARRMALFIKKIDDPNHLILDELQALEIHPDLKTRIDSGYACRWVREQQLKKTEQVKVAEDARMRLFIDGLDLSNGRLAFQHTYTTEAYRFGYYLGGGIEALAKFAYKKMAQRDREILENGSLGGMARQCSTSYTEIRRELQEWLLDVYDDDLMEQLGLKPTSMKWWYELKAEAGLVVDVKLLKFVPYST